MRRVLDSCPFLRYLSTASDLRAGFLNLSAIDVLGWRLFVVVVGICALVLVLSVHWEMLGSTLASTHTRCHEHAPLPTSRHCQMSPGVQNVRS